VSNVIQSPTADERAWTELSRGLREALSPNVAQEVIDWILADLKPRFMKITLPFNYSFQCPPGCELILQEAGKAFERFLHEYSNQWLLQMVQLEGELWASKSG
jgi:hypothetical protein